MSAFTSLCSVTADKSADALGLPAEAHGAKAGA
jgi:hypothetical protein